MAKLGRWMKRLLPTKGAPTSTAVDARRNRLAQWRLLGLIAIVMGGFATASVIFFSPPPPPQTIKPAPMPKTRDIGNTLSDVEKDAWRAQSAAELESIKRELSALHEYARQRETERAKAAPSAPAVPPVMPPNVQMTSQASPFTQAGLQPPAPSLDGPGGAANMARAGSRADTSLDDRIDRIRVVADEPPLVTDSGGSSRASAQDTSRSTAGQGPRGSEPIRPRRSGFNTERFDPDDPLMPNRSGGRSVSTYIPAGTNMRVMLVPGMDAPTSGQGQTNPHPALFTVIDAANLPNGFSGDLQGCVITGNGYGDLSSERAYVRTDRLSCIDESGGAIDVKLTGYAAGEDGKAGLRGKIVSKTGAMLANAMWAGLGSGFGQAIQHAASSISTTPLGGTITTIDSGQVLRAGVAGGVAKSMDMLARYYIKLAENTFPVVEINAERVLDIVVTKGFTIERK